MYNLYWEYVISSLNWTSARFAADFAIFYLNQAIFKSLSTKFGASMEFIYGKIEAERN